MSNFRETDDSNQNSFEPSPDCELDWLDFVRRHHPSLCETIKRDLYSGFLEEPEDVAQDTWADFVREVYNGNVHTSHVGLLYSIARHEVQRCAEHNRAQKRDHKRKSNLEDLVLQAGRLEDLRSATDIKPGRELPPDEIVWREESDVKFWRF